ncbi:E-beta-farnesene synthase [Tanacetum coccineum]|uniref:E-beta-farnesene synthase n=1 Tax=Tanacetum coccineum TaxID=301880 RepID=A0ABQ5GLK6_9ASTR
METSEAPSLPKRSKAENEPRIGDEEADLQKAVEESLKEFHTARQGLLPPVVIREPESGKFQPLPEVQGKDQFIFQRRTSTPTESSGHDESSSLYAELGLTDSKSESDEEVPGIVASFQDEGQAGQNPGKHDEGQAGPNPSDATSSQPPSSHVVHAGPDLEHMDLEASDTLIQPNPEQMDEEFTTMAYPNDTSFVPLMTTPIIDLIVSQHVPIAVQASLPTLTATRISELEQHMADLVQANLALEERMDKHGSRLYKLENLNIPHQVSKAVDEIVTDAIDWAIQAPLGDRFKELPEADIKEILHHRMWESNSYQAHEDHKQLYEALENSMARDHTDQLLTDLAEARRKKKKRHASSKTPPGSLPHQPPPLLPLAAEYTAWKTTDTRLKPFVLSIPEDLHMDDDTTHDEQVQSSGDEYIGHDHIPTSIPSFDLPVSVNNWASALASTYAPPLENSLLVQTGDMAIFMDWFCKRYNFGVAYDIGRKKKSGRALHFHLEDGKWAYYPVVGLEKMIYHQLWDLKRRKARMILLLCYGLLTVGIESYLTQLNSHTSIGDALSFVFSKYDFTVIDSLRAVTFRDKYGVQMIMRFNEIHKLSDGTLQQINEALDYRVKEFKVNRMNPGLNTRFWTRKMSTEAKSFCLEEVINISQRLMDQVGIFGWILVTGTFVLCGVFLVRHNVTANPCVSMNQWVENPTYHTALDDILPCVDNATALETSMKRLMRKPKGFLELKSSDFPYFEAFYACDSVIPMLGRKASNWSKEVACSDYCLGTRMLKDGN